MDAFLVGKNSYFAKKMFFLELNFQDEVTCMPLACFVFWFFTVNAFQFLYLGIRMHSSILIVAQNGCISSWKNVIFFWKMFLLKLNFQDEDHLYANCLFHILPLYCKCFLFQFLIDGIRMHIRILRRVQTWRIIS